ncbi:RICIN domain-containing protein [Janthinobacterium agaricidamnosum]|uniref:Ricin-type beta-trefoil lectin domain protein n=1 Tax=Janthinobacterium agaricidamnosum NBRC 102515 = DSM 9628 TaxID=1349767 RepID=W0V1T0_9BURK|nr:RICIN domain-containing protein [Janthinobacterium agaricidamnosum]CDG82784.1 ricin-type beta-trefoil lectin domain protein [Janthinobacterium agaricidamnosum NBRC 102515 = DSM 9628]
MKTTIGKFLAFCALGGMLAACGGSDSGGGGSKVLAQSNAQQADAALAAITPGGVYTLVNPNSGKALQPAGGASADGTVTQIFTANGTAAQQWQIVSNANGTYTLLNQNGGKALDVLGAATPDSSPVGIYASNGTGAQQWQINANADGTHTLINQNSGKALHVSNSGTANGSAVQIFTSNGSAAQKWQLTPAAGGAAPDFGPNVLIFDPSMSAATIQAKVDQVYGQQRTNQFGNERYALLFKPGTYSTAVNVGFYTHVAGLGLSPDDTHINGGTIQVDASWFGGNATQNFWRSVENISLTPSGGTSMWAVSQAAPMRRMHIKGNLALADNGGWSSGGFMSDSLIDGTVNSQSQQQWLSRNSKWGNWVSAVWNMVFVGSVNAPASTFPNPPNTTIALTPQVREKPFLTVDGAGNYSVFVPALRTNSQGITWTNGVGPGQSLPISQFYIARANTDTAATLNAALSQGKHLLLTPGIYKLNDTLRVNNANTVVLGLGLATLTPTTGLSAMNVADVDGVSIAGVLFDAGVNNSPVLLDVGPVGSNASHAANPTVLFDTFFRVGGAEPGKATISLRINSRHVIGDNLWIWRADHGREGVVNHGWTINPADNGLTVNGADVTIYGLAVEHYQKYQTLWNGERGKVYFYQSEAPYDVPNQNAWMDGSRNGYASYKVADHVTSHQAWGVGVYCYFNVNPSIKLHNAFEVPASGLNGAMMHNMTTVSLGGVGEITHILNGLGDTVNPAQNNAVLVQ